MILPNNGKVVIIDDQPEDVKNLAKALTREKMPFLFFKDLDMDDLPDSPVNNVRLVFLDFDLGLGGNSPIEKIRLVQARMERILEKNTPYILVIWSQHEDQCLDVLKDEFANGFKDFSPIVICSLDKIEIKTLERTPGNDVISHIREKLKTQLTSFETINVFLLWESIVNKSCGEIVNDFTKIFEFNANWNESIKSFLFRLAKANVGDQKVKEISSEQKLQLALETINSALIDSIEKNIKAYGNSISIDVVETSPIITANNLVDINTKLHLLQSDHLEHFSPGNIYYPSFFDEGALEDVIKNCFDKKAVVEILASKPTVIKVDVTPVCDYSQDKGYTRLLTGVLVDGKFKTSKKSSTPIFIYDLCPVMKIQTPVYMIFDFRYIKSIKKDYIKEHFHIPRQKIRSQLLNDVQAGISNHMNRPGIVSVN